MNLKGIKDLLGIIAVLSILIGTNSCEGEDPATTADIAGTYIGQMTFADSTFEQSLYSVTVEALPGSSLLITPSTNQATEWTSGVINTDGVFNCTNCTVNQLSIRKVLGNYQLDYTFEGNEQFFGTKQ